MVYAKWWYECGGGGEDDWEDKCLIQNGAMQGNWERSLLTRDQPSSGNTETGSHNDGSRKPISVFDDPHTAIVIT